MANLLLEQAEKRARKLQENYDQWGWLGGYEDVIDRIRQPGKELYAPMSTVNDRRHGHNWPFWRTWAEHARLRASARLLVGLSPIASGALTGIRAYVVGQGFTYRAASDQLAPAALIAAVQAVIDEHLKDSDWCVVEQEGFFRSRRDGELFLLHEQQGKGRLDVEIIEPEQVQAPPGESEEEWSYGVRTRGRKTHRPLAYHVVEDVAEPGRDYSPDELYHLKLNVDRKVKRGLTDFCYDTHDSIRTAGRVVDHIGQGAAIQASIAMIRQHATASPDQVADFISAASDYDRYDPISGRTEYSERFHPGKIVDVDAGQQYVVPPFASNVSGYVEVVRSILQAVAVRWNAPEWILSADASGTNYASSVTAESPFVKRCYQEQETYKAFFGRSVELAVRVAARAGRIRAHGRAWGEDEVMALVQVQVEAPNVEVRDDFRTAQVDQIYVNMGVKSPRLVQQELGVDADQVQADIARTGGQGQQDGGQPAQGNPDDPTAALRGSVGGSAALLQLQQAYYQGTLPRDACIANGRIVYGFSQEDAEALFPERKPDAPGAQDQQGAGGGMADMLGGDVGDANAGGEGEGNPLDGLLFGDGQDGQQQPDMDRPGTGMQGPLAESRRLHEREITTRNGQRRCYDDTTGKQVKCPPKEGGPARKPRGKKQPEQQQAGDREQPTAKKPTAKKPAAKTDKTSSPEKVQKAIDDLFGSDSPEKALEALMGHNHATLKEVARMLAEKAHGGVRGIAQRLAALVGSKPGDEGPQETPQPEKPRKPRQPRKKKATKDEPQNELGLGGLEIHDEGEEPWDTISLGGDAAEDAEETPQQAEKRPTPKLPPAEKEKPAPRKPPIAFGPEDLGDPGDLLGDDNPAPKRKAVGDVADEREARVQAHAERVAREEGGEDEEPAKDPESAPKKPAKKPAAKKAADTRTPAEHAERLRGLIADTKDRYVEAAEANQLVAEFTHLSLADLKQVARDAGLEHVEKTKKGILGALADKFTERRRARDSIEV